jgi:DNA-binding MarR family transcriptional regulator
MPTTTTFGTPVIGQTEKALNAILHRQLTGTGLNESLWVTLTLTIVSDGAADRNELISRVAGALKVDEAQAQAQLKQLADAQLLQSPDDEQSPVRVTDAGQQRYDQIRSAVNQITHRLWDDLPAGDLATAGRVLSTVLERANAELAA